MRRPVLPTDVITLARALLASGPDRRAALARSIARGAVRAQRFAQLTGRVHPRWGDGSLDAAARRYPLAREPFWDDPDYLCCLQRAIWVVQSNTQEKAPDAQRIRGLS